MKTKRPLNLFVTAGQVSDYIGARALLSSLPDVDWLPGDRGYDADWFREALERQRHTCLHPWTEATEETGKVRQAPLQKTQPDRDHVRQVEGLGRVATRYDRCPKIFLSAIALAALVFYWL